MVVVTDAQILDTVIYSIIKLALKGAPEAISAQLMLIVPRNLNQFLYSIGYRLGRRNNAL